MRILDTDIQEIVNRMSKLELDRFWDIIIFTDKSRSLKINPLVDSSTIQKALERMDKIDASRIVDDDRAISEITDEDERVSVQMQRAAIFPGRPKKPVRSIPRNEIKKLIQRAQTMNAGKKYAEQFVSMSKEEIKEFRMYDKSVKLSDDSKYMVDPEYGVSAIEKYDILKILESQAYARELVAQVPEKKLKATKSKFEQIRNNPSASYNDTERELDAMINKVFGAKAEQNMLSDVAMVDFANAFEAREKAIEEKSKNSFLSKLKSLFKGRGKEKQKALPKGSQSYPDNEYEATKRQKDEYYKSIAIDHKDLTDKIKAQTDKMARQASLVKQNKDHGPSR